MYVFQELLCPTSRAFFISHPSYLPSIMNRMCNPSLLKLNWLVGAKASAAVTKNFLKTGTLSRAIITYTEWNVLIQVRGAPPTSSSKMPTNYEQKEVSLVLSLILKCPSAVHTQRSCLSGSAIRAILTGIRPVGEADVLLVQKLQWINHLSGRQELASL